MLSMPKPLTDRNGYACMGIQNHLIKEVIDVTFYNAQKREIELLSMLVALEERYRDSELNKCIQICSDNIRNLGQNQLQLTNKAQGCPKAIHVVARSPEDDNVYQVHHVQALNESKKYIRNRRRLRRRYKPYPKQ
jgi:hypothetical protein